MGVLNNILFVSFMFVAHKFAAQKLQKAFTNDFEVDNTFRLSELQTSYGLPADLRILKICRI